MTVIGGMGTDKSRITTAAKRAKVRQMLIDGCTLNRACTTVGISYWSGTQVRDALIKEGYSINSGKRDGSKKEKCIGMLLEGVPRKEIVEKLGVSPEYVNKKSHDLAENGIFLKTEEKNISRPFPQHLLNEWDRVRVIILEKIEKERFDND